MVEPDLAAIETAPEERHTQRDGENEAEGRQRRRRRRRRGRGGDREGSGIAANAPQPPDDALEAMAKIGGLRPNATLENDEENAEPALFGADETAFDQQDPGRSARRDGRRPRRTPGDADVGTAADTLAESARTFESQPESAELSGV